MPSPAIILVRPQLGENIGAAARVMANFGLSDLRIVAPRDGWPNAQADSMAAHAKHLLEQAKIFETTEEAVGDLHLIYATCCRMRDMEKPVHTPRELMPTLQPYVRTGFMFGPERTGLENADMAKASAHIFIPVDAAYQSLNLAQAVAVMAYEWFSTQQQNPSEDAPALATQGDLEGLLGHLEERLDAANFYQAPEKKPRMLQNIRNIFSRNHLTYQEIQTLRGIIRAISR